MGRVGMDYDTVLAQVLELLQREKRLSYRVLKRRLGVDDDELEDLQEDLIYAKKLAVDEAGRVLVWTGSAAAESSYATPWQAPDHAPLTYTPPHLTEKILASRAVLEGERKQVTVLFADLKDSTELIRGLDPEAAQQLLDPAIHCMMDAVHRFEGTVNQVLGDGIMALFGAPLAHEDHALRASYAALAMQAAMHAYTDEVRRTHGLEMRMRVGINSGEVVVRAIGNDLHMDYSAVGETTHLAARMEQLATPGSIRLTADTVRLVEGLVRVNALGPVPVKGVAEPVEVFDLVGATAVQRRLQAATVRGLTPFVGRQTELASLQQALAQAGAGHGQIAAVVGEAGVGQSRLVYEFVHTHHLQGWRVLESASVSYGKSTPYFPVIDLLRRYCHVEEHDDTRTVRAKVTGQILTLDETLQETLPALLALLEALPADSPFAHLDPSQRRQRTLEALKRMLLRESQVQPLLLVFEDLHWIDAETQALLGSLVESLPMARLLLLVNYRPEYQHGWGSKTYYTQLRLDALPPQRVQAFLQALLGDNPSLTPLKQFLIARTQGNPFFLEESVRTLVETGVLVGAPGAYRLAQPLASLQVPATVQAVLAARIDRLPAGEKRLLQTAAVIGTEVPGPLLQAIAELSEDALQRGLTHLQAAEFLYETSLFPERVYTFKHALTHEVAYGGLLQERRRTLHTRIVAALEVLAGDRVADQVERLAYHALRSEVWEKAVAYCRQAGGKALARSAHRDAVACYEHALDALQHLPESRSTLEQGIDLRFDLRNALYALAHQERILTVLREAEALAEALGDPYRLGQVAVHMGAYFILTADPHRAIAAGERASVLAATLKDTTLQLMAQRTLGLAYGTAGAYPQAVAVLKQAVSALTGARAQAHFGLGYDSRCYLPSMVGTMSGRTGSLQRRAGL
jgi:class 3 adenylate cyclase/tetratricopeptide (TPR) repeat protein